jgi:hypothetical protein
MLVHVTASEMAMLPAQILGGVFKSPCCRFCGLYICPSFSLLELELELKQVQTHMTKKPLLRAKGTRMRRAEWSSFLGAVEGKRKSLRRLCVGVDI